MLGIWWSKRMKIHKDKETGSIHHKRKQVNAKHSDRTQKQTKHGMLLCWEYMTDQVDLNRITSMINTKEKSIDTSKIQQTSRTVAINKKNGLLGICWIWQLKLHKSMISFGMGSYREETKILLNVEIQISKKIQNLYQDIQKTGSQDLVFKRCLSKRQKSACNLTTSTSFWNV